MAEKTRFQKWRHVTIHRSQIQSADYNPRQITNDAYEGLSAGIREHGQVMPLVWNEKTGTLVSGHQRLEISDEKHSGQDYTLTVLAVSFDPKKEKQANLILNNPSAQGRFDMIALGKIMRDTGLHGTGFTSETVRLHIAPSDADLIFGRPADVAPKAAAPPPLQPQVRTQEAHVMVVFQSRTNADEFQRRWNFDPDNRYVAGADFLSLVESLLGNQ